MIMTYMQLTNIKGDGVKNITEIVFNLVACGMWIMVTVYYAITKYLPPVWMTCIYTGLLAMYALLMVVSLIGDRL